jgi:hypothetical protein
MIGEWQFDENIGDYLSTWPRRLKVRDCLDQANIAVLCSYDGYANNSRGKISAQILPPDLSHRLSMNLSNPVLVNI